MGDHITNNLAPGAPHVHASNGTLATFFDVLTLAATARARTTWELQLALWLAESDQTILGLGMVGFDVSELGWTAEAFEDQRRFLLEIIDGAMAREGWERLPFALHDATWVIALLRQVREMVERLPREALPTPHVRTWRWHDGLPEYGRCELHHVYLHAAGCILCNEAPLEVPVPHRTAPPKRAS
ncbi:hypothetical protein DRW03_29095 [Corallococcus sp. H22C18031201]|uniref:hypothetical protein n=1 Tax=Citreicoccus inhibens TaxID=2849499 RepID=UPI000E70F872|nr:hypothetical protein [Citreicoccus inhibens]MBU8897491.1 hypothetical protein [Citreicoccus inhibens]RJS16737.1 hypothetical protein DRW03_29095 [Corallococcus sp. H22C18031201]